MATTKLVFVRLPKPWSFPKDIRYPYVALVDDYWNDFGYTTLWHAYIVFGPDQVFPLGDVKILQKDPDAEVKARNNTNLPNRFYSLSEDFCSLGQDMEYYTNLKELDESISTPYFAALRDCVYNPSIAEDFKDLEGFGLSLLRFSEAEKAFQEAGGLFRATPTVEERFKFEYSCLVRSAINPHRVSFDFSPHPTGLNRMTVIIGRNGAGKTRYLASMAQALSGLGKRRADGLGFTPQRPAFSRVIAISYSVFDDFTRPTSEERTFSYKYCGIRAPQTKAEADLVLEDDQDIDEKEPRFLSTSELNTRLRKSHERILALHREVQWNRIVSILLNDVSAIPTYESVKLSFYDQLSAGQKILVMVLTEVVAEIAPESIILFDEPEMHLHPDMLTALARAFQQLLAEFDSYAIVATHSPLLLQETLSRQVRIFRRRGTQTIVDPLMIESFGENLSNITREVFAVDGTSSNFKGHLSELLKGKSPGEVEAMFPLGLPLQAQAYLQALYKAPEE